MQLPTTNTVETIAARGVTCGYCSASWAASSTAITSGTSPLSALVEYLPLSVNHLTAPLVLSLSLPRVSLAATLQYVRDTLALSSAQEEALSASATLSDALSMLVGGVLADRFGRKATAMFACSCSIGGALLAGVASGSFPWLVLWRLCSGVGNGLSILLIPMYISECVDAASRGLYLTLFQLG